MREITKDFSFPFIAKTGKGSSKGRGVYLIRNHSDLDAYRRTNRYAYIQEFIHVKQSARVVLLNGHIVKAYWLKAPDNSFLTNFYQGGTISTEPVPEEVLELAKTVAVQCGFDEVGLDIIRGKESYYVLEANMAFGTKGLEQAGLELHQVRRDMLLKGLI
jgi:ribosomal protein S6--L-glutamate ligase